MVSGCNKKYISSICKYLLVSRCYVRYHGTFGYPYNLGKPNVGSAGWVFIIIIIIIDRLIDNVIANNKTLR